MFCKPFLYELHSGGFSLCDFQFKNYFCIHLNVFRQHACFGRLCLDGSGTLFYTTVTREMSLKCIKHFLERINKGGPRFAEYIGLTLLFLSLRLGKNRTGQVGFEEKRQKV